MKLDEILGTIALPLEHDGLAFRIVPFTTSQIAEWSTAANLPRGEDESQAEWNGRIRDAQLDILARHLRRCLTDGSDRRVTSKWVSDNIPNVLLGDLADFLVVGKRPEWSDSGN